MEKPRITLIEPNQPNRTMLNQYLSSNGYIINDFVLSEPTSHDVTEQALITTIEENSPELVLLAYRLSPSLDSISIARQIKYKIKIPVLLILDQTTITDEEWNTIEKLDPAGFIQLPFCFPVIIHSIQQSLLQQQIEQDMQRWFSGFIEEKQLYNKTMETIPIGIIRLDLQGQLVFANKKAEEILQLSKKELSDRSYNSKEWKITDFSGNPFPNEKLPFFQVKNTRKPVYDIRHALRSGKEQILLSINAAPLFDSNNTLIGVVSFIQDVTELVETTQQLSRSKLSYQQLFDTMLNGVAIHEIVLDEKGKPVDYIFLNVNKQFETLTGLNAPDIIGKSVLEVMPDTEPYWIENYGKVALTGKPLSMIEFSKALNKYYHIRAFSPERGKFAVIFDDVTEQKKAELALKEANKNLEEMIYIASHDLQVPLISMEGYASELLEDYQNQLDENGIYCLSRLKSNAQRMHKLVLSLLDISRLNTRKFPFEMIQLESIIRDIQSELALVFEQNEIHFQSDSMPPVFGDKERIKGVFRNLITNAINYGGRTIHVGYDSEKHAYFVKDDGIGIPKDQLKKIFKPGERLKKVNVEGVGMGLTFCQRVIHLHRGTIWAESNEEEKGSIFYFALNKINLSN